MLSRSLLRYLPLVFGCVLLFGPSLKNADAKSASYLCTKVLQEVLVSGTGGEIDEATPVERLLMPNVKTQNAGAIVVLAASLLTNVWGIYVIVAAVNISSMFSVAKLNSHDLYFLVPILLAETGTMLMICMGRNARLLRAMTVPLYVISLAMFVLGLFKFFYLTQAFGFTQASIVAARRASRLASTEAVAVEKDARNV